MYHRIYSRNLVLRRRASGAVKHDFQIYIRQYTSRNSNFECGYPHSNALLQFHLEWESCKPHKAARHLKKCDVIISQDILRKFLTLSNQIHVTKASALECLNRCYMIFICMPDIFRFYTPPPPISI